MKISDLDPRARRLLFLLRLADEVMAESQRQQNMKIATAVLNAVTGDTEESEETRARAARILDELTAANNQQNNP